MSWWADVICVGVFSTTWGWEPGWICVWISMQRLPRCLEALAKIKGDREHQGIQAWGWQVGCLPGFGMYPKPQKEGSGSEDATHTWQQSST